MWDISNMSGLKEFVEDRLAELERNPFEAARKGGLERSFVNDILIGKKHSVSGAKIPLLAEALDTTSEAIIVAMVRRPSRPVRPTAELPLSDVGPRTELSPTPLRGGARDLPVPGIALGGSEEEGDFQLNGEVQYFLDRPAGLVGRKRAFAVVIRNESMIHSYRPGWPIFVDPDGRQPVAGVDDVLIELYPAEEGRAGPAFVKKLVSRRGNEVVLWQQNPEKEIRFATDRVKQILRVIPYPEAMGLSV